MPSQFNPWPSINNMPSGLSPSASPQQSPQHAAVQFTSDNMVSQHIGCNAIAKPPRESDKLVSSDEYLGIELELEKCASSQFAQKVAAHWESVADGSLKLHGREYRFKQPLAGKDIVDSLDSFSDALSTLPHQPYHAGNRGSTHFHLNVSNSSVPALYYIVLLSYFMEPVLMAMCKEDRRSNSFAVSVSRTKDSVVVLDRIREGSFMFNDNSWKYRSIGLNSIYGKGSLEYRMFHSTHDMDEVLRWANAVLAIKKVASKFGDALPDVIKNGLENSPQDAIDELFNGVYDFSDYYDTDASSMHLWEFTRMYTYNFKDELPMSSQVSSYYKKVMGV